MSFLDPTGAYFETGKLTNEDKNTFQNHRNEMNKSPEGRALLEKLDNAPYPINLKSCSMAAAGATNYARLNEKGDIFEIDVYLDYSNGGLETTIEELCHVEQSHDAKGKAKYEEDVKNQVKTMEYEDRPVEKEAKSKTELIKFQIDATNKHSKTWGIPEIFFRIIKENKNQ